MKPVLLAAALALGGLGCFDVDGSGDPAATSRTVAAFERVQVDGTIELDLTLGKAHSVTLEGDDNLLPLVETKVEGDKLIIQPTKDIDPDLPLVARVTAPNVSWVRGLGVTKLRVHGVDNESLELVQAGAGSIDASGETKKLTLAISGAGRADVTGLKAPEVAVDVSGAGNVKLASPAKLEVDISGAGSVSYEGDPEIIKNISGAGSINRR